MPDLYHRLKTAIRNIGTHARSLPFINICLFKPSNCSRRGAARGGGA
ncbi:MAG: hypothetical protein ACI9HB_001839, partial [Gammaproteobacteria bacterium]